MKFSKKKKGGSMKKLISVILVVILCGFISAATVAVVASCYELSCYIERPFFNGESWSSHDDCLAQTHFGDDDHWWWEDCQCGEPTCDGQYIETCDLCRADNMSVSWCVNCTIGRQHSAPHYEYWIHLDCDENNWGICGSY